MKRLSGRTVVVIHGWSDNWKSMRTIGRPLGQVGADVHYVNYESRENSAVYEDFAEGLQTEMVPRTVNEVRSEAGVADHLEGLRGATALEGAHRHQLFFVRI